MTYKDNQYAPLLVAYEVFKKGRISRTGQLRFSALIASIKLIGGGPSPILSELEVLVGQLKNN